jgi:HK97 family phage major capsid protein
MYMNKISAMREKRAGLWEQTKSFLDTHTDKDGKLSAEDAAAYDQMEQEVVDLGKDIERLERQASIDAELATPTSQPLTNQPGQDGQETKTGRASDEYRKAMLQALRTNFRQVSNVLEEGVDTNGGYLVPEEYDRRLIDVLNEENIMRGLATTITTSGEHKINLAATKPAASWIEEGGALTFGDATFDQILMDAYKLHVAIKITEELLYDNAFGLESYIIDQFGKAIGNAEEDAFLNGDGKHKPTGLFTSAKVGVTTSSANISADDMINLVYSLKRPYRKNASFITNDQTLSALRKLKDNNNAYIWQPSYQAGEPDRLLGYTLHTSAYVPTIAAGKPVIAFGDYSYYNIGDRGSRSMQELKELFAGNGMIGYVMKERVDGKLVLPEAVQLLQMKGTAGA